MTQDGLGTFDIILDKPGNSSSSFAGRSLLAGDAPDDRSSFLPRIFTVHSALIRLQKSNTDTDTSIPATLPPDSALAPTVSLPRHSDARMAADNVLSDEATRQPNKTSDSAVSSSY